MQSIKDIQKRRDILTEAIKQTDGYINGKIVSVDGHKYNVSVFIEEV